MGQRIVIKILNTPFELVAESPEQEAQIREAAEKLNKKYYEYAGLFPGKIPADIFSFVAMNAYLEAAQERDKLEKAQAETKRLHEELKSYLEKIEI